MNKIKCLDSFILIYQKDIACFWLLVVWKNNKVCICQFIIKVDKRKQFYHAFYENTLHENTTTCKMWIAQQIVGNKLHEWADTQNIFLLLLLDFWRSLTLSWFPLPILMIQPNISSSCPSRRGVFTRIKINLMYLRLD